MHNSGHRHNLVYEEETEKEKEDKDIKKLVEKVRKRNVVWFNPPYNAEVKTNVGKKFLQLIDKHFPPTHKLRKVVNRNCIKISYSCMKNMRQIIQAHNHKIMAQFHEKNVTTTVEPQRPLADKTCNCRKKEDCPLDNKCLTGPMIYKAVVSGGPTQKVYIGCTEDYKKRLANHKMSFKNSGQKNATCLSKYVWGQKLNPLPNIKWELVRHAWPYKPGARSCDLCLCEKLTILAENKKNKQACLNKRNESTDRCVHKLKFRLNRF